MWLDSTTPVSPELRGSTTDAPLAPVVNFGFSNGESLASGAVASAEAARELRDWSSSFNAPRQSGSAAGPNGSGSRRVGRVAPSPPGQSRRTAVQAIFTAVEDPFLRSAITNMARLASDENARAEFSFFGLKGFDIFGQTAENGARNPCATSWRDDYPPPNDAASGQSGTQGATRASTDPGSLLRALSLFVELINFLTHPLVLTIAFLVGLFGITLKLLGRAKRAKQRRRFSIYRRMR